MRIAWRERARGLKQQALMVYYAARDPRLPRRVRVLACVVAAYAISPIDLIPDFIPVLGLLDDLVLIPIGVALVVRWTPERILADAKRRAAATADLPTSWVAALMIALLWLVALAGIGALLWPRLP